jgi:plasmid stability protein
MTVRIDKGLLAEVKRAAKSEGRSVSAEVVHVLRGRLAPPERSRSTRRLAGLFAQVNVAEDVAEYRLGDWLEQAINRRVRGRARKARR